VIRNGDALGGGGRRAAEEWQATRKRVVVQIAVILGKKDQAIDCSNR
jgi:hypothetical protein